MSLQMSVRLNQIWLESTVYNVWNMFFNGTGEPDFQEVSDEIRGVLAEFPTVFADDWTATGVTISRVDGSPVFSEEIPFTAGNLSGSATANNMPTQTAPMTRLTAISTPPNRGRIYWAGATVAGLSSNGRVAQTFRDAYDTMATALATGLTVTGGTVRLVIARKSLTSNQWLSFNDVDNVLTVSPYGIQRRRRPGSGI